MELLLYATPGSKVSVRSTTIDLTTLKRRMKLCRSGPHCLIRDRDIPTRHLAERLFHSLLQGMDERQKKELKVPRAKRLWGLFYEAVNKFENSLMKKRELILSCIVSMVEELEIQGVGTG